MKSGIPQPRIVAACIMLGMFLGLSADLLFALEANSGSDRVIAMNSLTDPNSPIKPWPVVVQFNGAFVGEAGTPVVTINGDVADAGEARHVTICNVGILNPNALARAVQFESVGNECNGWYLDYVEAGFSTCYRWNGGCANDENDLSESHFLLE